MQQIGKKIRELRKQNSITQEKMGSDLNIDRSVVSRWESDKIEPTIDQLRSISDYFKVPITYFLEEEPDKKKQADLDELLHKMENLF